MDLVVGNETILCEFGYVLLFALSLDPVISISSPTPKGAGPIPGAFVFVTLSVRTTDTLVIVAGAVNVKSVPVTDCIVSVPEKSPAPNPNPSLAFASPSAKPDGVISDEVPEREVKIYSFLLVPIANHLSPE